MRKIVVGVNVGVFVLGFTVGIAVVGEIVGPLEGINVGMTVGARGKGVGAKEGRFVGLLVVGTAVGLPTMATQALIDGAALGPFAKDDDDEEEDDDDVNTGIEVGLNDGCIVGGDVIVKRFTPISGT